MDYYRSYIKDFSMLTQCPQWSTLMETKFQKIKEAFKESPLRAAPDFNSKEEFI